MSKEERLLLEEIELSRKKMFALAKEKSFYSNEVVEISQYLDDLLNRYDDFKNKLDCVS